MITKEMLTCDKYDITGLNWCGTWYFIDFIDTEEEFVRIIQTDLVGQDEPMQEIPFEDLIDNKSAKLYIWKQMTEDIVKHR